MVVLPSVIAPVEVPPTVALAVTVTPVVPRLMTAVSAAEIVPAMRLLDGAVAVTPPVNAVLSVASLPSVNVPVLLNVDAPAIELLDPVIETLYAPAAAVRPPLRVRSPWNDTAPVEPGASCCWPLP